MPRLHALNRVMTLAAVLALAGGAAAMVSGWVLCV